MLSPMCILKYGLGQNRWLKWEKKIWFFENIGNLASQDGSARDAGQSASNTRPHFIRVGDNPSCTVGENLLTCLALMHIHYDFDISVDDVTDIFSRKHVQMLMLQIVLEIEWYSSAFFKLTAGVRQGGVLSPTKLSNNHLSNLNCLPLHSPFSTSTARRHHPNTLNPSMSF